MWNIESVGVLWFSQTATLLRDRVIMVINIVCNPDGLKGEERLERKGCGRILRGCAVASRGFTLYLETWLEVWMQKNLRRQQLIIPDFFLLSIWREKMMFEMKAR